MGRRISTGFLGLFHAAETSWEKADNDFVELPEDTKGHLQASFISLSPFPQGQIPRLYFFQSFPILSCIPMPHLGLGSLPRVLSLLLGGVSLQFSHPFSVFRFLLSSSVHRVLIELKSENTWTNCKLPESPTQTAQGCLFFWVIFPFVWFCFVFKSFSCCDNSLILVLWSFSKLTQFFISLGLSLLCLPSLDIAGKAIFLRDLLPPSWKRESWWPIGIILKIHTIGSQNCIW